MTNDTDITSKILALYAEGPAILETALKGLTESDLDLAPASDAWSIRQIVHHLADGDDIWKTCIKLNWFSSHEASREDLQHWNIENMGDPNGNYDRWYNASPYFFLDQVSAPVQLICGANNPRCPASESLAARDKLIELGKEVELFLYADEGHSFLKIENVIDAEMKRMKFLADVLEQKKP